MRRKIWKGGGIVRAKFLDRIRAAFTQDPSLPNLMVDPDLAQDLNDRQASWRRGRAPRHRGRGGEVQGGAPKGTPTSGAAGRAPRIRRKRTLML